MINRADMLVEFQAYVNDIFTQPEADRQYKLADVLARLADTAVRVAASSLVPMDADIAAWSDLELAEHMSGHVVWRGGARLPNSAWHMMLEAAKRLRQNSSLTPPDTK